MNNLYGSICLSDIPKELIQVGKNGKKYLNIYVNARREPSQWGHTHYIKVAGRIQGQNTPYIGDLKPSSQTTTTAPSANDTQQMNDVPF
ncbi:hypothetical protein EVA_14146 [gut metagenome]|uniref:Uncharacterized protein n=1 Tax=gut metagenome TaxID=749906 RepID=J9CCQ4_9ZZZZ